jgi:tripartite-type tricarboxylate transporter receptor subunit TctC
MGWTMLPMPAPAQAQNTAAFYKDKTVDLVIGFNTGGGYDTTARLVARRMGGHMPGNPTIVVKNMPGAGSLNAANRVFNISPKDGTEFGLFAGNVALDPLIGGVPAKFDGRKFTWIGSPNKDVSLCISWHTTPFASLDDVLTNEMITGSAGTSTLTFPTAMNNVLGTKFKLVKGYNGTKDLNLAMQRGEIQGFCGTFLDSVRSSNPEWLREGTIHIVVQMALKKSPELPDVSFVMDYAKTEEQRQLLSLVFGWMIMPRAFGAPPDIPADRAAALRQGFADTMKDKAFVADAEKVGIEIDPVTPAEMNAFLADAYKTPKPLVERVYQLLDRGTN